MIDSQIIEKFLEGMKKYRPNLDFSMLEKACNIAQIAHKDQKRKSGEPYIIHPIQIATKLSKRFEDLDIIISAILHDTVEDCEDLDIESIYKEFGDNIGFIVDAVTKTNNYYYLEPDKIFKDKVEKLLYGWLKNVRCLILKNCDRQNNLATLKNLPKHKQIRMAFETQAIYRPLQKVLECNDFYTPIPERWKKLKVFLKKHKITNESNFKETLYNQTFSNFDDEIFNMVYAHTTSVTWKIEDKEMYIKFIETEDFDEKVEVLSLEQDSEGKFKCIFRYRKWQVYDGKNWKFTIENNFFS